MFRAALKGVCQCCVDSDEVYLSQSAEASGVVNKLKEKLGARTHAKPAPSQHHHQIPLTTKCISNDFFKPYLFL